MIGYMENNTMQVWLLPYGKTSKRKRCSHHQKSLDLEKKLKMSRDIAESAYKAQYMNTLKRATSLRTSKQTSNETN
jgi:hypothetical protein